MENDVPGITLFPVATMKAVKRALTATQKAIDIGQRCGATFDCVRRNDSGELTMYFDVPTPNIKKARGAARS